MNSFVLETIALTHRFSENETILNDVNLKVKEGSIYGFLGPNGAGKTTTLKLILGLLRKQQGEIMVFGKPFERHRVEILQKVGSLIESPSLYGHLNAVDNLSILQKIYRCPEKRIADVLKLVDLSGTGNKKTSQFSLGMRQRLSIAMALLNNPSLIILDEPSNGLDPNSIIAMRELLKKLNQEHGISIIISSHLLSEIEKLVTHVGVIHRGKMLFQGTLEDLKLQQQNTSHHLFSTSDDEKALQILLPMYPEAKIAQGKIMMPMVTRETVAAINRLLMAEGVDVYEIAIMSNDLETIFMELIK